MIGCTAISSQNASSSVAAALLSGTNKIEVVSLDHQSWLFECFFYSLVRRNKDSRRIEFGAVGNDRSRLHQKTRTVDAQGAMAANLALCSLSSLETRLSGERFKNGNKTVEDEVLPCSILI